MKQRLRLKKSTFRDLDKLSRQWPFEKSKEGGRKPKVFVGKRLGMTYRLRLGTARAYAPTMVVLRKIFKQDFRGKKILELGPGVPVMLKELKRRGAIVIGLDADPFRKDAHGLRIEQGKIEHLDRYFLGVNGKPQKFHAIISKNVFEPTQMSAVHALELPTKEKLEEMKSANPKKAQALIEAIAERYSIKKSKVERVLPTEKRKIDAAIELLGIFQAVEERLFGGGHFIIQTTGESVTFYHYFRPLLEDAGFEVKVKHIRESENQKTGEPISIFIAKKPLTAKSTAERRKKK